MHMARRYVPVFFMRSSKKTSKSSTTPNGLRQYSSRALSKSVCQKLVKHSAVPSCPRELAGNENLGVLLLVSILRETRKQYSLLCVQYPAKGSKITVVIYTSKNREQEAIRASIGGVYHQLHQPRKSWQRFSTERASLMRRSTCVGTSSASSGSKSLPRSLSKKRRRASSARLLDTIIIR